ncbi:uncharacterized protein LOC130788311 [Actinidia eriantha]|uniref:uncharacterized protein LOC130788311 n=1 Tax=Actinidia eriantha TaxID=165200 RepID=UPI002588BF16|nr:uncharacterized protein LOC130788311 [Actinidia eriantha]
MTEQKTAFLDPPLGLWVLVLKINVSQIVFEVFQFGIQHVNRVSLSATVRLLHCDMEIMGSSRGNRVSACRGWLEVVEGCLSLLTNFNRRPSQDFEIEEVCKEVIKAIQAKLAPKKFFFF